MEAGREMDALVAERVMGAFWRAADEVDGDYTSPKGPPLPLSLRRKNRETV